MKIDFSLSINDWVGYFKQLFDAFAGFLAFLGIKLFPDPKEDEGAEPDNE